MAIISSEWNMQSEILLRFTCFNIIVNCIIESLCKVPYEFCKKV